MAINRNNFHRRLVTDVFSRQGARLSDDDALLLMSILLLFSIRLAEPLKSGTSVIEVFEPLTQRGAAAAVASMWTGTRNPRRSYTYWYDVWNTSWGGYGRAENLSEPDRDRMHRLIAALEAHPAVSKLEANKTKPPAG